MSKSISMKPLTLAMGAAFITSLAGASVANAAENPFGMTELTNGYMVAEGDMKEGKCGAKHMEEKEGKCGGDMSKEKMKEGKCGGDKKAGHDKMKEGKCGEGMKGMKGHEKSEKMKKEGKCGEGKCGGKK